MAISGKSVSTRITYARVLYDLILALNKLPEECTQFEIINYFMECKNERELHSSTLRLYITGLKYYLKYIAERMDLFAKVPNPVIKAYNVDVLNIEEVNLLFKNCENTRELLIIQLLYETGIRVSELVKLKWNDFDFQHKILIIRNSKNRKTRTINFGKNLDNTLNLYLNRNQSLFSENVLTRQFHPFIPLSHKGVGKVLKSLVERSGITKQINVHSLRHTFAVHYLNFGGTIYQLQKLLGHSCLTTTMNYLQYAVLPENMHISILDELLGLNLKEDSIGAKVISLKINRCG